MRKLTLPLAFLVAFSVGTACSDDDRGGGGGLAGEASGGADGNSGGSGTGAHLGSGGEDGAVGGGTCVGETESLVEGVEGFAIALSVSDEGAA